MRPPKSPSLISTAVLRRHLETMERLDIEYDFLPRESEILHLHFWDAAFAKLKEQWRALLRDRRQKQGLLGDATRREPRRRWPKATELSEDDQKVIVRSNGTVDYVGKDIAYHIWKFGLLGTRLRLSQILHYPDRHLLDLNHRARMTIRTSGMSLTSTT